MAEEVKNHNTIKTVESVDSLTINGGIGSGILKEPRSAYSIGSGALDLDGDDAEAVNESA